MPGRGGLQGLSFRFEVRANEGVLARRLTSLLSPLQAQEPPARGVATHVYALNVGHDGSVEISLDDQTVQRAESEPHAVAWLLWHVTQSVVEASGEHLLLHAAAVEAPAGTVILPGPPNVGKTTFTVALVRAGLGYLTDEIVAIPAHDADVMAFPRPMTVEAESWVALATLYPTASSWVVEPEAEVALPSSPGEGPWWHIQATRIRPDALGRAGRPTALVFPSYQPGAPTRLEPMATAEAVLELATNAFNLTRHGGWGLRRIVGIAEGCSCFRLTVSKLHEACQLVLAVGGTT